MIQSLSIFLIFFITYKTTQIWNSVKLMEKLQVQYSVFPFEPFESKLPIDFLSSPSMFVCIFSLYFFLHDHDASIKIKKLTLMCYYHLIFRPSSFVSCADNIFIEKVQNHMLHLDVLPFSIHSVWTRSSDFPKLSWLRLLKIIGQLFCSSCSNAKFGFVSHDDTSLAEYPRSDPMQPFYVDVLFI